MTTNQLFRQYLRAVAREEMATAVHGCAAAKARPALEALWAARRRLGGLRAQCRAESSILTAQARGAVRAYLARKGGVGGWLR